MSAKVSLSLATLVLCTLSAMGTAQISYQVTDIKLSDTWRLMFLFTLAFWKNGLVQDMGTLGGDNSTPAALNNAGQAVGSSQLSNGHTHGFLWQTGHIQDLGVPPGYTDGFASAINEIGQIVGSLYTGSESHPAIYASGQWTDLNDLVPPDFRPIVGGAVGINNPGTIVVTEGSKFSGRTLLLVPKTQ